MAHKKGVGSSDNGRDSKPKYLGVKLFGGQHAIPGNIIIRQRGTRFHPGLNTYLGRDFTIHANVEGHVVFKKGRDNRTYVHIEPLEGAVPAALKLRVEKVAKEPRALIGKPAPVAKVAAAKAPKAEKAAAAPAEVKVAPVAAAPAPVAAAPVAEEVVEVAAAPVAEEVVEVAAAPVVEEVVEVAAAPVVEEVVEVAAAPVVEEVVEVAAAPVAEEVVEVAAAPVVKEVVEVAAAPVVEEVVEVAAAPVVEEVVEVAAAKSADGEKDKLVKIEGIGPKIEEHLHNAGILTFRQLADASFDTLKGILNAAGSHYAIHDPTTWPEQAQLAADGHWDELKELQDRLNGGK
jgi:ribosomal protein L27